MGSHRTLVHFYTSDTFIINTLGLSRKNRNKFMIFFYKNTFLYSIDIIPLGFHPIGFLPYAIFHLPGI